jgi:hypothetical protein
VSQPRAMQVHKKLTQTSPRYLRTSPEDEATRRMNPKQQPHHATEAMDVREKPAAGPVSPARNGAPVTGLRPRRGIAVEAVGPAVTLIAVALLVAGCGGDAARPGASTSHGGQGVQRLDAFAACMRGHGVPNFYFSRRGSTPSPASTGAVLPVGQYQVDNVNPQSPQFQSALKTCLRIFGIHRSSLSVQHGQLVQALKSSACMRTHGYPGWPDPLTGPDGITNPSPPADVDTSSPQFQKAAAICGVGLP